MAAAVERLGVRAGASTPRSRCSRRRGSGACEGPRSSSRRPTTCPSARLVRCGDDAPRRAHAGRAPRRGPVRGAPRARGRGPALRVDVRAGPLHGPPSGPYLPDLARSTSRASRPPSPDARARGGRIREVRVVLFEQAGSVDARARRGAAARRHVSTIHLLPPEQVAAAVERLETRSRRRRAAARDGAALAAPCRARAAVVSRPWKPAPSPPRTRSRRRTARRSASCSACRPAARSCRAWQSHASPPGAETQRHYHAVTEEIYFILEGRADMELDGSHAELGPGEAVAIPPGAWHEILALGRRRTPLPVLLRPALPARGHLLRVAPRAVGSG